MTTYASTQSTELKPRLHVAVGVLTSPHGEVLLSQRASDKSYPGAWEFPGGKVEPDETAEAALTREFFEELGISVTRARPLIRINYDYPEFPVVLDVWRIIQFNGEPKGLEGQSISWVKSENLENQELLPANQPIVHAIQLPNLYAIIDADNTPHDLLLERLVVALTAGARLVQLRAHSLSKSEYKNLAEHVLALAQENNAVLMLNTDPQHVVDCGAQGVHLTSKRLMKLTDRPLSKDYWVAASCHNLKELEHAGTIGVDFVVLSPVRYTTSHSDAVPLGWSKFRKLCEGANFPVYALGGMSVEDVSTACLHGGQGLAMVSGLWNAPDTDAVVRSVIAKE